MAPNLENSGTAFLVVCLAGLSTGIGASVVFEPRMVKLASKPVLAAGLGFSGGVMMYVSFAEIFPESRTLFEHHGLKPAMAYFWATFCVFAGMLLLRMMAFVVHLLDKDEVHEGQAPHEIEAAKNGANENNETTENTPADAEAGKVEERALSPRREAKHLKTIGLQTALAIAIHNVPEGLAGYVGTLNDPSVGITLSVAIAIHNIPEGLCVALPIYYATGSRVKGFAFALFSGFAEPVGAVLAWAIIKGTGEDMSYAVYAVLFGVVTGLMIMITLDELIPVALRYDPNNKVTVNCMVVGMAVMAASLCLFQV
eukprot:CAMPEP_0206458838 /NCGR_PEP_ID=MMETSP0324_2-20121206/23812_1 /ASSEMBLY_ACC=CAM_ASM_000836 /TAXON_ID=2866 /ORGANISM="Crypthecodinium cohnii, Strain Seligo" /LENGTH=311 /DNA_ID=CAMNT_0053930261 /DNA_START=101 /DNA_END=1036 /DNA_ORIENTATION=-